MIKTYCAISGAILVIIVCSYWYFECYRNYKSGCVEKISFQKFLEIFETSHYKISLNKGFFYYSPDVLGLGLGPSYRFYFSILDTFRYERWRKTREHELEEDSKNYKMTEIEKAWQKDAERHKEKEMKNGNTN